MLVVFAREPSDFAILIKWLRNENADLGFRRPKPYEIWQILIKAIAKKVVKEDQLHSLLKFTHDLSESDSMCKSTLDTVLLASSFERRQELWRQFIKNPQAYTIPEWDCIFKGFNHEFLAAQYESFIEPFFNSLVKLYSQTNWEYFRKFYTELFPQYNEDFDFILSKIEDILTELNRNDPVEEGTDRLVALLAESMEEIKKRRYCHSLNIASTESSQKDAFGLLLAEQRSPRSDVEQHVENRASMQNMLENLKSEEEDNGLEPIPEAEQEEESKLVINKLWKKNESDKFELSDSVFKEWVPSTTKLFQKMFASDVARFSVLPKQFETKQTEVKHLFAIGLIILLNQYKEILEKIEEKYYYKLVYVFLHLQGDSNKYPQIGWQEISSALKTVRFYFEIVV